MTTKPKKRRGKRGRRKPKPLYERSCSKYFGQGFEVSTQDLRDILSTLADIPRQMQVSKEVKSVIDQDLAKILTDPHSSYFDKCLVMKIALRMAVANYEAATYLLGIIQERIQTCTDNTMLENLRVLEKSLFHQAMTAFDSQCDLEINSQNDAPSIVNFDLYGA